MLEMGCHLTLVSRNVKPQWLDPHQNLSGLHHLHLTSSTTWSHLYSSFHRDQGCLFWWTWTCPCLQSYPCYCGLVPYFKERQIVLICFNLFIWGHSRSREMKSLQLVTCIPWNQCSSFALLTYSHCFNSSFAKFCKLDWLLRSALASQGQ